MKRICGNMSGELLTLPRAFIISVLETVPHQNRFYGFGNQNYGQN
jgi:hypothetical protein